jgi:hypothetical protein
MAQVLPVAHDRRTTRYWMSASAMTHYQVEDDHLGLYALGRDAAKGGNQ